MLRIVTEQRGHRCTISLHGKLAGEWVPLLDHCWQCLSEKQPGARIRAVLTDVTFIDGEGERLLEKMAGRGVQLAATSCMNRHLVERIRKRAGTVQLS